MKTLLLAPISLCSCISLAQGDVSGDFSMVSDYRLRGISQSAGNPAIQGSFEININKSFYMGTWASSVDYGDQTSLELDYFLGYHGKVSEKLGYSATAIYLTFEGNDINDHNFWEGSFSLYFNDLSLNYTVAEDTLNTGLSSEHIALSYNHSLPNNAVIGFHSEHNFGEFYGQFDMPDYQNYEISLKKKYADLEFKAAFLLVETKKEDEINTGIFRNDEAFVFGIKKYF